MLTEIGDEKLPVPVKYRFFDIEMNNAPFVPDDIYPKQALFVQRLLNFTTEEESIFTAKEENRPEDVGRTLGVLQENISSRAWISYLIQEKHRYSREMLCSCFKT